MSSHDRDGMVRDNGFIQSKPVRLIEGSEMDPRGLDVRFVAGTGREAPRASLNREQLLECHERLCKKARELMEKKNSDYTDGESGDDPFANLKLCEALGICTTTQGMVVRLSDKIARLARLVSPGRVARVVDENIDDTILDIINYAILIAAYRSDNDDAQVQARGKV